MRIILVLTLLFLTFSAYAKPPASPDEINRFLSDRGLLGRIGEVIDKMEAKAKSDGVVTKQERKQLHHAQNNQSKRIHRQKHDAQQAK